MQTNERQVWFRAKKYGWGWGLPCAWQGWVAFGVLMVFLVGSGVLLLPGGHVGLWIASFVVWQVAALILCLVKGEKPRWRWGKD